VPSHARPVKFRFADHGLIVRAHSPRSARRDCLPPNVVASPERFRGTVCPGLDGSGERAEDAGPVAVAKVDGVQDGDELALLVPEVRLHHRFDPVQVLMQFFRRTARP
jgi:hypothetical protein